LFRVKAEATPATSIPPAHGTRPFSDTEREEIRKAITIDLGERAATAQQEIDRCRGVLQDIKEQERKLLHMHYQDRITGELFDDEQTRLRHRRQDAETLIERLNLRFGDINETLDVALEILGEDLQDIYLRAEDGIRRPINQAIFKALYICDETITKADLAGPFAELRTFHNTLRGIVSATPNPKPATTVASTLPLNVKVPVPSGEREPFDVGSISNVLVGDPGFEPGTSSLSESAAGLEVLGVSHVSKPTTALLPPRRFG
jgi:hypothetical protein